MQIFNGRYGASIDGDFVPFLIGARINRLRYIVSFLPIGRAMGRPLRCRSGLGPRPPARPDDLSCADFGMDRYKNRDQEIAPTAIGYRDFVVSCGSGLRPRLSGSSKIAIRRSLLSKSRS